MFRAIMKWDENNHPIKWQDFTTESEATKHIAAFIGKFPNAFVVASYPQIHQKYTTVDSINKTVTHDTVKRDADISMRKLEGIQINRRAAYQLESDTLFFEEQRGEVPAGTHAAKVAEIKARFPK